MLLSDAWMRPICKWLMACGLSAIAPITMAAPEPAGIIAAGTAAATPYYVHDSGKDGPSVMIVAGVHGNEPAGASAAEQIRHWPIGRGRLVVVPRANVTALAAEKRNTPGEEADLANLNRNFPSPTQGDQPRGALATALWEFARQQKPDWLLDLHEGANFNSVTNKSAGSSVIVFRTPQGKALAPVIQSAVNATITNQGHHFTVIGPPVDGSLARAAGTHLNAHSMILETTTKSQPLSLRTRQHRIMVHALLRHLDMIDGALTPEIVFPPARAPGETRIALYDAEGTGGQGVPRLTKILATRPKTTLMRVCGADIANGVLPQFDLLIVPGGSASKQAAAIGTTGRARIGEFVRAGGGYIGICAGSYLATSGFSWGLKILDAKTASPKWRRGTGPVKLELTDRGREILSDRRDQFDCRYANGPILVPAQIDTLPDFEPLAFFRSELAENGAPPGIMIDSPAIVAGRCDRGRVVCSSPHPESTPGLEVLVSRAIDWVATEIGAQ